VIGTLNSVLWSKNILYKTNKLIYQPIVQSTLLYGAETRAVNKQQANKLLATEMDFWRRSARKSKEEKALHNTIAAIMNAGKNTEEKRLRWFGHVKRRRK
jgi:hypothetical protein